VRVGGPLPRSENRERQGALAGLKLSTQSIAGRTPHPGISD
jgi:hypothetical protein